MAALSSVERDLLRLNSQIQLFEDCIATIENNLMHNRNSNSYFPELQATYERLMQNARENEEYEERKYQEKQEELIKEMQEVKKLLLELEEENRSLQEKQKKEILAREVLDYLKKGEGSSEEVLRAAEEVRTAYEKCERFLDLERQKSVISDVERLRKHIVSGMQARNVAAGVSITSSAATILLRSHPIGRAISGTIALSSLIFYLSKRKDIEITWQRIEMFLNRDAKDYESLTKAVENLDKLWQTKFGFSIFSEKFREICTIFSEDKKNNVVVRNLEKGFNDPLTMFSDEKLQVTFVWFAKEKVWKTIKEAATSHYFYSTIGLISGFCDNPVLQVCVPGLFIACQLFLVIHDYSSDKSKLEAIDQGIKRMKEQEVAVKEFLQRASS